MVLQNPVDDFPGGFNSILASEERPIAFHCVAQKPFVRRFLSWLLVGQGKLPLLSDEFLARELDARGESDDRVWREPKAQVIRSAGWTYCVGKEVLRRAFQLHHDLRCGGWKIFAGAQIKRNSIPAP